MKLIAELRKEISAWHGDILKFQAEPEKSTVQDSLNYNQLYNNQMAQMQQAAHPSYGAVYGGPLLSAGTYLTTNTTTTRLF